MNPLKLKIVQIQSAFNLEYNEAKTQLAKLYEAVESFFSPNALANDEEAEDNKQLLKATLKYDPMRNLIKNQVYVNDLAYTQFEPPKIFLSSPLFEFLQRLHPTNPFLDILDEVNKLTQKEVLYLNEQLSKTENALEAVMPYAPQDVDGKTNAWLKDGFTDSKVERKVNVYSQIAMAKIAQKLNLVICSVVDVKKFYGLIVPRNCKSVSNFTAEKLFGHMHRPTFLSKLKKFNRPPEVLDLVFARFNDNFWYRAKVLEKCSYMEYKIFYVDYGNHDIVTIEQMRFWCDEVNAYPFQAVECTLVNIEMIKDRQAEGTAFFEKMVLQKSLLATVTCNTHPLHVTLKDCEGFNIGELLLAAGYAKSK